MCWHRYIYTQETLHCKTDNKTNKSQLDCNKWQSGNDHRAPLNKMVVTCATSDRCGQLIEAQEQEGAVLQLHKMNHHDTMTTEGTMWITQEGSATYSRAASAGRVQHYCHYTFVSIPVSVFVDTHKMAFRLILHLAVTKGLGGQWWKNTGANSFKQDLRM